MFKLNDIISVDGFDVRIKFFGNNDTVSYSGYVYPFTSQFSSIEFYVSISRDEECSGAPKVKSEIFMGGQSLSGIETAQYLKAAQVALNLSAKYEERITSMNSRDAVMSIANRLHNGQYRDLNELLSISLIITEKGKETNKYTLLESILRNNDVICKMITDNYDETIKNEHLMAFFETLACLLGHNINDDADRKGQILAFLSERSDSLSGFAV